MSGIVRSQIGHLNGSEVVRVEYDPAKTDLAKLVDALKKESSFYDVVEKGEPHFVESKHSLRTKHPELYYLDLTEQQAIALNSWSYFGGPMPNVLTPGQKQLQQKLKAKLSVKSVPRLVPARSGKELQLYREKLMQWLNE